MKLIIDIPEDVVEDVKKTYEGCDVLYVAVKYGIPFDLEGLKSDMKALNCGYPYGLDYLLGCLDKRLGITI